MIFYLLYKFAYFLSNFLPIKTAYWVAERFSDIKYFLSRKDKETVASNLHIILKKDEKECIKLSRKVFRSFGLYLVDFFRMVNLRKKHIKRRVRIEGLEHIEESLKNHKGAIILTCHIGNWELGGVSMGLLGYDISAVALNHANRKVNKLFINQRERQGIKVIKIDSAMKRCISALRRNGLLALVGDRDFSNSGILLDFFGVPTTIPKGPAILSMITGAPIVPGFFIRDKRYKYKLIFEEPIYPDKNSNFKNEEDVKNLTSKFVPLMEKYIKMYPEQWLVFRRFWETPVDMFVL